MVQHDLEAVLKSIADFDRDLEKLKNPQNHDFVEGMQTVLEWLEDLFRVRMWEKVRLSPSAWKGLEPLLFPETLGLVKKKKVVSQDLLFKEIKKLLNRIISVGNIEMSDFDLLQFNLARLFGKNADAVIEHIRETLHVKITNIKNEKLKKEEEERTEKENLASMPEKELEKIVVSRMFEFAPSARTREERIAALKANRHSIIAHKETFRNFASKLHDAAANARAGTGTRVGLQLQDTKRRTLETTRGFKTKAVEITSNKGLRKSIEKTRRSMHRSSSGMALQAQKVKAKFHEKAEKLACEEGFKAMADASGKRMLEKRKSLHRVVLHKKEGAKRKGAGWQDFFGQEINKAKACLIEKGNSLEAHEKAQKGRILLSGKEETGKAKRMMLEGKEGFSDEVAGARKLFAGKGDELKEAAHLIDVARDEFLDNKEKARNVFDARAKEVEGSLMSTMHEGRAGFEIARDGARQKFSACSRKMAEKGSNGIMKMKSGMKEIRSKGRQYGAKRLPEAVQGHITGRNAEIHGKSRIAGKNTREKMKASKDLFELDLRFARYRIKNAAGTFRQRAEAKNEEFKGRQQAFVSRHKAKQKAHFIRNILRTIRGMK